MGQPTSSIHSMNDDEMHPFAQWLIKSAERWNFDIPTNVSLALNGTISVSQIRDHQDYETVSVPLNTGVAHPLAHDPNDTTSSNINFVDLFSGGTIPAYELKVAADGKGVVEAPSYLGALSHSPADQRSSNIDFVDLFSNAKTASGGGGATSGGSTGSVVATYNAGTIDGSAGYDIRIDFQGSGWTQALQDPFIKMANYLASNIIGDLPGTGTYNGKSFDDLYVTAKIGAIDGVGGILGQAGPSAVWTTNNLTAVGSMQFDSADASNYAKLGLWDDIVVHEFMHVEGFGSLWNYNRSLVSTAGQYTGSQGLAAYKAAGHADATYVPVETGGGSGTAGSHWSEAQLNNELMTGYINNPNHMDAFSVMSLADLGYVLKSTPDLLLV